MGRCPRTVRFNRGKHFAATWVLKQENTTRYTLGMATRTHVWFAESLKWTEDRMHTIWKGIAG